MGFRESAARRLAAWKPMAAPSSCQRQRYARSADETRGLS